MCGSGASGSYCSGVGHVWEGVRERVERLRSADGRRWGGSVFGANGHRFELLPPLSPAALAEVEAQFEVALPDDYRSFLAAVSAGGAGPDYGLFPLVRDSSGRWSWRGDGAELTDLTALNVEFQPGDVSEALAQLRRVEPSADDETAYQAWLDRYEEVLWRQQRTRGAICLCHEGCAYRDWLVVSGPYRGQIWDDERAGDVDLSPNRMADGTIRTFSAWYLTWLAKAELTIFGR
jgi:hypothetical protein